MKLSIISKKRMMTMKCFPLHKLVGVIAAAALFTSGCAANTAEIPLNTPAADSLDLPSPTPSADTIFRNITTSPGGRDFSELEFTPWDIEAASAHASPTDVKPYTIMIYMNGSDLESVDGAASNDLYEMLNAKISPENANIIIFTGGANRWRNNLISEDECALWQIRDNRLERICGVGQANMGDAGTLASFIRFSQDNYPAGQYALIFWDHGGGSIAGYGNDENFNNSNLTLLELDYAFLMGGLDTKRLALLGFDSCLMATAEMGVIAADYADYMVASQDLEPNDGWDYSFLTLLNENPYADGSVLGQYIADCYMDYYGANFAGPLTMSVVELEKAEPVMTALGDLMSRCSDALLTGQRNTFISFATRRNNTKTFGEGTPRDSDCDMVDIAHMINQLDDLYPEQVQEVQNALDAAVIYNRYNSSIPLGGISAFYIYGGKDLAALSLATYESLNLDSSYTEYLKNFANALNVRSSLTKSGREGEILIDELAVWQNVSNFKDSYILTSINRNGERTQAILAGHAVCLYPLNDGRGTYAIPARHNGKDCDIIVDSSDTVMGVRYEDGYIIQKGYTDIERGDTLAFYYQLREKNENYSRQWYLSEEFAVEGPLTLEYADADSPGTYYSRRITDVLNNIYFSEIESSPQ